jgi:hypothetical protein
MTRDFHFPLAYVMDELPLAQAFALAAWHCESNPWGKVDRATDGYLAQEAWRRREGKC